MRRASERDWTNECVFDRKGRPGVKRHLCIKPLFIGFDDDISSGFLPLLQEKTTSRGLLLMSRRENKTSWLETNRALTQGLVISVRKNTLLLPF